MRRTSLRGVEVLLAATASRSASRQSRWTRARGPPLDHGLFAGHRRVVDRAVHLIAFALYKRPPSRASGRLLMAVLISSGLVLVNVGVTAYLMFLSFHDLKLLTSLLLFSVVVAAFFALTSAASIQSSVATLVRGVREMGDGQTWTPGSRLRPAMNFRTSPPRSTSWPRSYKSLKQRGMKWKRQGANSWPPSPTT